MKNEIIIYILFVVLGILIARLIEINAPYVAKKIKIHLDRYGRITIESIIYLSLSYEYLINGNNNFYVVITLILLTISFLFYGFIFVRNLYK